jgi:iron complex outermembrane recepter protein
LKLQSYLDLTENLEFNSALYYIDELSGAIGDYTRVDLGLTWRPSPNVELSIWGQNLLDPSHRETSSAVEFERAVLFQATLRY